MAKRPPEITSFKLEPGVRLAHDYEVLARLGTGWEGEVYLVRERLTGIERAAKLFFPRRNIQDRTARFYARKLHKLRNCPIVIHYHHHQVIMFHGIPVTMLISEYVAGLLLSQFLKVMPGDRLTAYQGLHLLHALAKGIQCIHAMGEYHGDLHLDNVIVQRYGLEFDLRLLDMFHWGGTRRENIEEDVVNLVGIFYEALGGARYYSRQPQAVKDVCRGLKRGLILERFRTAGQLCAYLESLSWH